MVSEPLKVTGPGPAKVPTTRTPARVKPKAEIFRPARKAKSKWNGVKRISASKPRKPSARNGPALTMTWIAAPNCKVLVVMAK